MDPYTFYTLGNIRHREFIQDAEKRRGLQEIRETPSLWQRFRALLSTAPAAPQPSASPCCPVNVCA